MANSQGADPPYKVEPFEPKRHERSAFSCGVARIDNYLLNSAKKHQKGDFVRVFVAVRAGAAAIEGFYVLNAHSAEAEDLPAEYSRNAPGHGQVPGAYLSIIGVDKGAQGSGLGRALMVEAFRNVANAAQQIGTKFLMLDVLDDGDPEAVDKRSAFYRKLGFTPLPSRPLRMFIALVTSRAALGEE